MLKKENYPQKNALEYQSRILENMITSRPQIWVALKFLTTFCDKYNNCNKAICVRANISGKQLRLVEIQLGVFTVQTR